MAASGLGRPPVALDIVEEHFDELDFLLETRERVIDADDWTLNDLLDLDERIDAHRDGLVLAQAWAVELARKQLRSEDTYAAMAAALVLLACGDAQVALEPVAALRDGSAVVRARITAALSCAAIAPVRNGLADLAASNSPAALYSAVVLARHGERVAQARRIATEFDGHGGALAAELLGRNGDFNASDLSRCMRSSDRSVRRAAIASAARCGLAESITVCRSALAGSTADGEALRVVGCVGDQGAIERWTRVAESRTDAIAALGRSGRASAVALLLELADDPESAARALCAIRRITGAPGALAVEPEAEASPDELRSVRDFWNRKSSVFEPAHRYQLGREIDVEPLGANFGQLTLGIRRDVWLGARLTARDTTPVLEFDTPAVRQMSL